MERESFESSEIAKVMNDNFVSIKVDREERPDVDKIYMTFVQATSGGGGWPMNVWLTPDLKPIVGGTYFPPDDRYFGRPGFKSVLLQIADKWKENPNGLRTQGGKILEALTEASKMKSGLGDNVPRLEFVELGLKMLAGQYDSKMGGFGKAPKFPQPVNLAFLLRMYAVNPDTDHGKKALEMTLYTLKMMAKGGMNDHVAKGFHRYSTDQDWHVPHFEKMLYDQSQLVVVYVEAFQITKDVEFANIARDIMEYVNRDLSHPEGGFYSAEDADSLPDATATEKKEGAFCVWEEAEIIKALPDKIDGRNTTMAEVFAFHYGIKTNGNVEAFKDPHDELKKKNVLIVRGSVQATADKFSLTLEQTTAVLDNCRKKLFAVRARRPKPHLDDKMITAWNGLMISGFARAGQILAQPEYTERAVKAASFVKQYLYLPDSKRLLRSAYAGDTVTQIDAPIQAFAEDYACLVRGLLDLYEARQDSSWLQWAEELQAVQDELFWDGQDGGYFNSDATDPSIIMRMKDDQDGAEPSANSVSAMNLLRLSYMLDSSELRNKAEFVFKTYSSRICKIPIAVPEMLNALIFYHSTPKQIVIVGERGARDTEAMLACVNSHFLPTKVLLFRDSETSDPYLSERIQSLDSMVPVQGKATAYVCENFACSQPVNNPDDLNKLLTSAKAKY